MPPDEHRERGRVRTMLNDVAHRLKARHPQVDGQSQAEILI